MSRIDAPQPQGLQDGEQRGCQLRAPDAARAVIVLAPVDGAADGVLRQVVVQRHLRVIHEHGESLPVIEQALTYLALLFACALG